MNKLIFSLGLLAYLFEASASVKFSTPISKDEQDLVLELIESNPRARNVYEEVVIGCIESSDCEVSETELRKVTGSITKPAQYHLLVSYSYRGMNDKIWKQAHQVIIFKLNSKTNSLDVQHIHLQ